MEINLKVKKLHEGAVIPKYATTGSAGFDLCARLDTPVFVGPGECVKIGTGLAFSVPENHVMIAAPRSGLGANKGLVLGNLIGVIDSDYRGEVTLAVWNRNVGGDPIQVNDGDRIIQAMIIPVQQVSIEEVSELDETERGSGGFGHTGVN